jgi:predicted RNA-binding Zn ribbon-like protein
VYGCLSLDYLAMHLAAESDLAGGLVACGVLSYEPAVHSDDLAESVRLQGTIRRIFAAARIGRAPPSRDRETLNSYAADEPPVLVLRPDGSAASSATDPIRAALASIARDAIETAALHAPDLRICEGENCGRMFFDRSRARARRWCSMQQCGNRAKVAAFRRRR